MLSTANQLKVEHEEKLISAASVTHNSPARMPRENFIKMVRHYFSQSERSGLPTWNITQLTKSKIKYFMRNETNLWINYCVDINNPYEI